MRSDIAAEAINAAYETFGVEDCTYTPPVGAVVEGLTLMLVQPDTAIGFEQNIVVPEIEVRVRASELTPAEGGRFVINGRTYRVLGKPDARDVLRLEWRCVVADLT